MRYDFDTDDTETRNTNFEEFDNLTEEIALMIIDDYEDGELLDSLKDYIL